MNHPLALLGALVLIGASWALTFPLTKLAVLGGYRNFGIIFWSSAVGAIFLGLVVMLTTRHLPLNAAAIRRYVFVALCGTILPSASSYTAAEYLPAGVISVAISLMPMMALPLAMAAGIDSATPGRVAGLALGLAGVLLIALPETSLPDRAAVAFIPLALAATFFYALEGVGLGRIGRGGLDPVQLLFGASALSAALALPVALANGTLVVPTQPYDSADVALLVSGGVNALAYCGYVWLVGRAGAVFAAQGAYIVTGFGVLWSMLLLGEVYSIWIWAAMALIFAGLFLVQPRPRLPAVLVSAHGSATLGAGAAPECKE
ncbi:MAG: DMT family transporter [Rhodobacteraceae bacterium]|nr:DMT family transporter [Paracoccaceae bacterium]